MVNVLLLEKKQQVFAEITTALTATGFRVHASGSSLETLKLFRKEHIDLILADFCNDACELVSELRAEEIEVPFLILTENAGKKEKHQIYRAGADGYTELPLDTEELILRIRCLLKRCRIKTENVLVIGDCRLHSETMSVEAPEKTVELRRMEYLLLEKLLSYPGHIFTRSQLLDDLWGYNCESGPRTVDTHIRRLRKNLKGIDAIRIRTIRGIGYQAAIPRKLRGEDGKIEKNEGEG